jgi:hypothetical protein
MCEVAFLRDQSREAVIFWHEADIAFVASEGQLRESVISFQLHAPILRKRLWEPIAIS